MSPPTVPRVEEDMQPQKTQKAEKQSLEKIKGPGKETGWTPMGKKEETFDLGRRDQKSEQGENGGEEKS